MEFNKIELQDVDRIQQTFQISRLCAKVLNAMQLSENEIREILFSKINLNHLNLSFLEPIITRIYLAKQKNEKVLICGDYDCDGICATTILYDTLCQMGIQCGYYIPDRFKQGYGLHEDTVDKAYEKGYTLLITVDNGVKATHALQKAKQYHMDVILTDHHSYDEADLIYDYFLHPNILPDIFHGMCGAGLALLLSKAFIQDNDYHTVLAGIASVADVVPLLGVNRSIVKECIRLLNTNYYPTIHSLSKDKNVWDETKIAFQIVPKLNSVGRLADRANVNTVVRYLRMTNSKQIQEYAQQLENLNEIRKKLSASMEYNAKKQICVDDSFCVLYDASFHEGLNGIVASRFVNQLDKPVMVLSENNDILKGSIRSNGLDLTNFFDEIKDHVINFGGHKEAAGISFSKDELNYIKTFVNEKAKGYNGNRVIDVIELDKNEITIDELESLQVLKPFGRGFELPKFLVYDTNIQVTTLGNRNHLKYYNDTMSYLYFNQRDRYEKDLLKHSFSFIGTLEVNYFRGKKSVHMIVEHVLDK